VTCENCRALYARIERADRLAVAIRPLVDEFRGLGLDHELVTAFDLYAAAELDARISEASTDEPAPQTQRSGDEMSLDEKVERSR
jgi:hypothetical protein